LKPARETGRGNNNVKIDGMAKMYWVHNGNVGVNPLYAKEEQHPSSKHVKLMAAKMVWKNTDSKSMTLNIVEEND